MYLCCIKILISKNPPDTKLLNSSVSICDSEQQITGMWNVPTELALGQSGGQENEKQGLSFHHNSAYKRLIASQQ